MTTSITLSDLYQRQITLIGKEAFEKIRQAKILVIGAGGLGCPALQYLASSGAGNIGILDFDLVSASNLQRQILFQINDIGKKKVEVAKARLQTLAPFCEFHLYPIRLSQSNAREVISGYDVILDCTDNFATKFLIHDTCFVLQKVLVQSSVYQYEGQLQVFDFRAGEGPCLRCLWPQEPQDGCTGTCAQVGVMGPLLGVMGSMQAMETIKLITSKEHLKNGETLFVDLLGNSFDVRRFKKNIECSCCVKQEFIPKKDIQIELPQDLGRYTILDVRSLAEFEQCPFVMKTMKNHRILNIPLENFSDFAPDSGQTYLIICARGVRSLNACQQLIKNNIDAYSLIGGIEALLSEGEI